MVQALRVVKPLVARTTTPFHPHTDTVHVNPYSEHGLEIALQTCESMTDLGDHLPELSLGDVSHTGVDDVHHLW